MLEALSRWLNDHREELSQLGFTMAVTPPARAAEIEKIEADLRSPRFEWMIELWNTGFSEFYVLDWEHTEDDDVVTHFGFANVEELHAALEQFLGRFAEALSRSE